MQARVIPLSPGPLPGASALMRPAGVQPPWIQGIPRGDGFGVQDMIALIQY